MKALTETLTLVLEDDVHNWVMNEGGLTAFQNELSFFMDKFFRGAAMLSEEEIEDAVQDNMKSTSGVQEDVLRDIITQAMQDVMKDSNITFNNSPGNQVEDKKEENEPPIGALVSFGSSDESEQGESEISEDDLDDLASLFGV